LLPDGELLNPLECPGNETVLRMTMSGIHASGLLHSFNVSGCQKDQAVIEDIFNLQGNANQNYIEIPSYTSQNGYHQKTTTVGEDGGRGLLYTVDGNII
jgi:hypothetical protein